MAKILNTRNYRLFHTSSGENRQLNIRKHRKLEASMKEYGFLECFPIIVVRDKDSNLVVKDGQHRLAIAEKLGLTVYYVEVKTIFDVAKINTTTELWKPVDYAQMYADSGVKAYSEGLEFADKYRLSVGTAFALLSGTSGYTHVEDHFKGGTFKVKDKEWAERVASIYSRLIAMSKAVKNTRLLEACVAVCRVPEFDPNRLLSSAERCREKLVAYSRREDYLDMLEDIYNFRRHQLVSLRNLALMNMRDRNPVKPKNGNHKSAK